jgi:2-oxoisovalerate dehydrogenase E2 component (dihydrolipoyl transacylase)
MPMSSSSVSSNVPYRFHLPDIGEGVAEGEILTWMVEEGQLVKEDQALLEVMTDKVTVEIPSPVTGLVVKRLVQVGETVPVGAGLVELLPQEGAATAAPVSQKAATVQAAVQSTVEPFEKPAPAQTPTGASAASLFCPASATPAKPSLPVPAIAAVSEATGKRVLAAPATRAQAKQLGVNLCDISGTGPHGRITPDDVAAFASHGNVSANRPSLEATSIYSLPVPDKTETPYSGMRKRIGQRLQESSQTIPSFALIETVQMDKAEATRNELKALAKEQGIKLTPLAFIARATALALLEFPSLNSSLNEAETHIVQHGAVHLGIAVDVPQGLMVPVLSNAHTLSLFGLAQAIQQVGQDAKEGRLAPAQLSGGTFTVSSIGSIGGMIGIPIINPPEAAILGVNQVKRMPVVNEQGAVVAGQVLHLSLSADHRLVDGATTARFMNRIKAYLEAPATLLV